MSRTADVRLTSTAVVIELHSVAGEHASPRSHDKLMGVVGEAADVDPGDNAGAGVVDPLASVAPGRCSYSFTYTCQYDGQCEKWC